MTLPAARPIQTEQPGSLAAAYRDALDGLVARKASERLAARDAGLWKDDDAHVRVIRNRLGWVDLPAWLADHRAPLRDFAAELREEGVTRVLLLGMGGSSLAPEVLQRVLRAGPGAPTLSVLDSTDPVAVRRAAGEAKLARTFFVVSSKSGTTVETRSQYRYFRAAIEAAGIESPGRRFAAVTDAGSALDSLAAAEAFRAVFRNPSDVGGRYSALSYFGMLPAALLGLDLEALAARAVAAREEALDADPSRNTALRLAAFLAGAAKAGRDKLTLLATPSLRPLGYWIEQLVAESTGKEGRGIVPVEGEPLGPAHHYGDDRVFVVLTLAGEPAADLDRLESELAKRGTPVARIVLPDTTEIAGEFYRWEAATAYAGAALGVDPFDEPNVQESKDATQRLLAARTKAGAFAEAPPRAVDDGVAVGASDELWNAMTGALPAHPSLELVLQRFLALAKRDDYLAVLAYFERTAESEAAFEHLRRAVRNATHLPALQGYGPRYLHSIGQLYKGGPATGLYLLLTVDPPAGEDAAIPGADYTFGELIRAQALGDVEALAARGKGVLRLHFTEGVAAGLRALNHAVERAVAAKV